MRAEERENHRYSKGAQNPIDKPEELMFSLLPNGSQKKLLDIGCGIGTIALELQKRGFQVTGVDFSEVAIKKCRQQGLDAIVSDVDKDGLRFSDNSFDVVWAGDVIEHVFDPIFLFEETHRVLKNDGCFLMTVPNDFYLHKRWKIFLSGKSIQSGVYRKLRQCKHHTFFSWELLEFRLNESKLSIDRYPSIYGARRKKTRKVTSNKVIGRLFGRKFIICAHKSLSSTK